MSNFLLLNGPNLNLLGKRETKIYGKVSLKEIENDLSKLAKKKGHEIDLFQSNAEHDLVNKIHQAKELKVNCIIFNPGAFTHSSIALRDALSGTTTPFIEVHISNIYSREDFRQKSLISRAAKGIICGFGAYGYIMALNGIINIIKK